MADGGSEGGSQFVLKSHFLKVVILHSCKICFISYLEFKTTKILLQIIRNVTIDNIPVK